MTVPVTAAEKILSFQWIIKFELHCSVQFAINSEELRVFCIACGVPNPISSDSTREEDES
ncbi:hypothetical protein [Pseudomonas moraviensis]|uniref:hypothetical protein n=1 Tax=Pseudomonas moraviensis TaxID=321662 RepID=UPI00105A293A|nr:hypothetical protein [Pseudomonas moraviensis]TDK55714.1 hypothetical protein E1508_09640 [Pseudomonas moraviensis]